MPVIPELRRLRQEDHYEFQASVGYITSPSGLARAQLQACLSINKKGKRKVVRSGYAALEVI